MAPDGNGGPLRNGVERVRRELLTALHFGRLGPGDRVPSVRSLAGSTGMNRKTVHRAYQRLADEGLLDLRPGSGTFIAETIGGGGPASVTDLLLAVNRCRSMAESLGLKPEVFASFLEIQLSRGFRDVPVTVTECNGEQLGILEQELRTKMGLAVRPTLLSELTRLPPSTLGETQAVITTDCHGVEVAEMVASAGLPVFCIALDPEFPEQIVEHARRGDVLMAVRDRNFAPVFQRLLEHLSVPSKLIRRIQIHETREAKARLWDLDAQATLHVSPLVESVWRGLPSGRFHRLATRWQVEAASLDRLRAGMALSLARSRKFRPHVQPAAPERGLNVHPS